MTVRRVGAARGATASRRPHGEDGYSPIEAAIVFPVLMLLVLGVVQFALLWHGRHVAEAAAQDGLRGARGYAATADLGRQDALSYLGQVAPRLLREPTVDVQRSDTTVTVQVTARVQSIIPLGLTVHERAAGPVERFVGPG